VMGFGKPGASASNYRIRAPLSAVTVRAAYFREGATYVPYKRWRKPRKSLGRRSKLVHIGPKHDVQQRYMRRSVCEQQIR
jgi:hypothetical protein